MISFIIHFGSECHPPEVASTSAVILCSRAVARLNHSALPVHGHLKTLDDAPQPQPQGCGSFRRGKLPLRLPGKKFAHPSEPRGKHRLCNQGLTCGTLPWQWGSSTETARASSRRGDRLQPRKIRFTVTLKLSMRSI